MYKLFRAIYQKPYGSERNRRLEYVSNKCVHQASNSQNRVVEAYQVRPKKRNGFIFNNINILKANVYLRMVLFRSKMKRLIDF